MTATDSGGLTTSQDVTIHVADVDDAPYGLTLTGSDVSENAPGAVIGAVNAFDADAGDSLTYSVSDSRFEIVNGDLKLKDGVSLDHEAEPHVTVTLTATDHDGLSTHQDVTIDVQDVNEAPHDLTLTGSDVAENDAGAVIGTVNTLDPDSGDSLTYTVSDNRFEIVDGALKLKDGISLNYEAEPSVNLHLTATDSGGLSTSQDVVIHVNDVNEAPTDLNFSLSGIALNVDGGNNAYFQVADQGDIVGGLTKFTIETQFAASKVLSDWDYMNLFSYNVGGPGDEIEIALDNNANGIDFDIEIHGHYIELKNFDAYGLLDGGVHQVSVTWDSVGGVVDVYADGVLVDHTTGLATGATITAGGIITLGQEQDSRGGGFDPTQNFKGAYHDVRIFDEVRSATDIANDSLKDVSAGTQGLVTDWRMDSLTDNTVVDAAGGHDLTLSHVTGTGWIESTPHQVAILEEHSPAGTVVTTMEASDPDHGETFTYSLSSDPSGLFEVVGNEVRVKDGAYVDYSQAQWHDLGITVTDSAGHTTPRR